LVFIIFRVFTVLHQKIMLTTARPKIMIKKPVKTLSSDLNWTKETAKNKKAYEKSVRQENEQFSLTQAKAILS